jgi:hypothetical protein
MVTVAWTAKKGSKEIQIMKPIGTIATMLVLAGSLASSVFAADDVMKQQSGESYCHMKLPAITRSSLFTDHPTAKGSTTADVVDYYGSCDESATSKDLVAAERWDALRDLRE